MASDYLYKKEFKNNPPPWRVTRRPEFGPNQVRCHHELRRGMSYIQVYGGGNDFEIQFVVAGDPYTDERGRQWVNVRIREYEFDTELSLADFSIKPYITPWPDVSIEWNAWNHIQFTDGSRHMKNCCLCEKRGLS